MEMVFCPGCASDLHDSTAACPVCGTPRATPPDPAPQRNPFKLIALCVLYAVAIWFTAMFVIGGVVAPDAALGQSAGGPLLLASIGVAIALTVGGKLPGTARLAAPRQS